MTDTLARPPVGFERVLAKRALLSALGPLAGLRAEGNVTATATGAPVVLPAFTYGVPVIGGKALISRMVKVLPSGKDARGNPLGWTVTSAGLDVPVRAVCGGPSGNLPADTPIIWQPLPAGLEPRGAVAAGGTTGGEAQPGPGRCARVVAFESVGRPPSTSFWESPGEGLPAIIVGRKGSAVTDTATVNSTLRVHTFEIFIASATYAGNDERAEEGELLLDAIEGVLDGLADVEGDVFSGPPCELGAEGRFPPPGPNIHVWMIEARVSYALERVDVRLTDGVSWQPWATTRIEIPVLADAPLVDKDVVDITAEQP